MIVKISLLNNSKLLIETDDGISWELREYFSFFVPGYKFMPTYRNKVWDGKIRLFDYNSRTLPVGLFGKLKKFCKSRNYECVIEETEYGKPADKDTLDVNEVWKFIKELQLSTKEKRIEPRDYQFNAICHSISNRRGILLSPTGSGKSLIIYCLMRWWLERTGDDRKILIIVPTTSLVEQMYSDFEDYSYFDKDWRVDHNCHRIYSGQAKVNLHERVFISTWQSIYKLPKTWFKQFVAIFGDEAHGFTAKSMTAALNKSEDACYRIGTTGTLDGSKTNEMVLEGHFGPIYRTTTTKKLQDKKELADLDIQILDFIYPEELRSRWGRVKYQDEIKWLIGNEKRNNFIRNLACDLEGNTLLLFRYVDSHGKILYNAIKDRSKNRCFFVAGEVDKDDREAIRKIVETQKNSVTVASEGVFSTGVNIKNIHNIIFCSPSKSQIKVLQSIGRGLRISDNGKPTKLFDIIDHLDWKSRKNYSLQHGELRYKIYQKEQFKVKRNKVYLK